MILQLLRTLKKEHFTSIMEMAISGGVASVLGAVGGLVIARYISPEVSGEFRYYGLSLLYWPIFHFATFDALHRLVPTLIGSGDKEVLRKHLNAATVWNVGVSSLVTIVFLVLAVKAIFDGNIRGAAGWSVQIIVVWNILFGGMIAAVYRGYGEFKILARIGILVALISLISVSFVIWFGYYGLCIRFGLIALIQVVMYYKFIPTGLYLRTSIDDLKNTIREGAPYWFWATLAAIVWFAAESTLVYLWGGAIYLGYLGISVIAREALSIIPSSCNQFVVTIVSNRFGASGGKGISVSTVAIATFVLFIITCLACYVTGRAFELLAPVVFPRYISSIPFFKLYVFGAAVLALELPVHVLYAEAKSKAFGIGVLCGVVTMTVTTIVLYPFVHPVYSIIIGALVGRVARGIAAIVSIYKINASILKDMARPNVIRSGGGE